MVLLTSADLERMEKIKLIKPKSTIQVSQIRLLARFDHFVDKLHEKKEPYGFKPAQDLRDFTGLYMA